MNSLAFPPGSSHVFARQYVWLKIYLREKDRTLYSGTEMHVAPYLQHHSSRCMPIKKSRAIQGKVKDKATLPTILQKINHVFSVTENLTQALDDMKVRFEKRSEDTNARIQELATTAALERQAHQRQQQLAGMARASPSERESFAQSRV
jgi:hypothetical protein